MAKATENNNKIKQEITQQYLNEYLDYDPITGILRWKKQRRKNLIGMQAGTIDGYGYRVVQLNKVVHKAHRLIWMMVYGVWPTHEIDHIDLNKDNNAISNLRDVPHRDNSLNQPRRKDNRTGKTGVGQLPNGKYVAFINVNRQTIHLGTFDNINQACVARLKAERDHGFHSR